jgi:hypothetical protein
VWRPGDCGLRLGMGFCDVDGGGFGGVEGGEGLYSETSGLGDICWILVIAMSVM